MTKRVISKRVAGGLVLFVGLALGLVVLAAPKPKSAASQPKPAAPQPRPAAPQDELARATAELDTFERKTNSAAGADADPALALASADKKLRVVEATTLDRVKSFAQLEANAKLLADVKTKLSFAKKPKGAAKGAPAEAIEPLEKRRSGALEASLLLEVDYLVGAYFGFADESRADALLSGAPDVRVSRAKKNLTLLQSPAGKARAKDLALQLKEEPRQVYQSLGLEAFAALQRGALAGAADPAGACKKTNKDELAWEILTLQAAIQVAMSRSLPSIVVAAAMPHHGSADTAGDVKRALFGTVLGTAAAVEAMKACVERSSTALAPAGAGSLARTVLSSALPAEKLRLELFALGEGFGPNLEIQAAAAAAKAHRADFDKHARNGASALQRHKSAVLAAKGASVDPKNLLTARHELSGAHTSGVALVKQRAQLRKLEDEAMGFLGSLDQAAVAAKSGLKQGRDANTALGALLAKQARDAFNDPAARVATTRGTAIGRKAADVIAYADGVLTAARTSIQKMVGRVGAGTLAGYPARVAQAQKDDAAIALRLQTVADQLKEADALASPLKPPVSKPSDAKSNAALVQPRGCEIRNVDWKNFEYADRMNGGGVKVKNGVGPAVQDGFPNPSVGAAALGDLNGNGRAEAYVPLDWQGYGPRGTNHLEVRVYEVDDQCSLQSIETIGGAQGNGRISGKSYEFEWSNIGYDPQAGPIEVRTRDTYAFVNGKLKRTKSVVVSQ
jgi:hypothetical protein